MKYNTKTKYLLFIIFIAMITMIGCPAINTVSTEVTNEVGDGSNNDYSPSNESNNPDNGDGGSDSDNDGGSDSSDGDGSGQVDENTDQAVAYNGTKSTDTNGVMIGTLVKDTSFYDGIIVITVSDLEEGTDYTYTLGSATGIKTANADGEITITKGDLKDTDATDGDILTVVGGDLSIAANNHEFATYKPMNIYDWKDLQAMRQDLSGAYTLQKNVFFPSVGSDELPLIGFVPIGSIATPFTGTLDGNGKKIIGLVINDSALDTGAGLFGKIMGPSSSTVVVKRLTIENPSIVARHIVGGLAGVVERATITEIAVTRNLYANSSTRIEASSTSAGNVAGGLFTGSLVGGLIGVAVGNSDANEVIVTKSYSDITVQGASFGIGGLAGGFGEGKIVGYALGDVISASAFNQSIGGLVGHVRADAEIIGYYSGDMSASTSTGTLFAAGGLVGQLQSHGGVTKVYGYVTGDIGGALNANGGLVGIVTSTTSTSAIDIKGYFTGNLNFGINSNAGLGGLLGFNSSGTNNVITIHGYSRGNIRIGSTPKAGHIYGNTAGTINHVGFYSGKTGEGSFSNISGTLLSTSTTPTLADALGSGASGDERDASVITGAAGFTGLIFGTNVGEWTYTSSKWPAINLGSDMPITAFAQPINP